MQLEVTKKDYGREMSRHAYIGKDLIVALWSFKTTSALASHYLLFTFMNKLLSYLNQIILTIKESNRCACVVIIGEPIPIMMQSLLDETGHIHGVRVYQYNNEYHADYLGMSKLFKVAYVIKDDHSIFVYDFDRIGEWIKKLRSLNGDKKFGGLSPTKIFIDESI